MYIREEDNEKRGISSFAIRIIAYIVLLATIANKTVNIAGLEWVELLEWFCFPIFAFLLAEGFDQSTARFRYFLRLVLFALISEVPYNLLNAGSVLYPQAQNGMFTLCLAYLAISAISFVYNKTYNLIITMAATYIYGWGAYYVARMFNCQFNSFGIMFAIFFFIANQVTYPKLVHLFLMCMLTMYLSTDAYISFIIGNIQYTLTYRAICIPAFILIWFYKGKRGPNSIPVQVGSYLFYPVMLTIAWLAKTYLL